RIQECVQAEDRGEAQEPPHDFAAIVHVRGSAEWRRRKSKMSQRSVMIDKRARRRRELADHNAAFGNARRLAVRRDGRVCADVSEDSAVIEERMKPATIGLHRTDNLSLVINA